MAHFRASIQGMKGEASRLGGKTSGIEARVNGWNYGVYVMGGVDETGKDMFYVYKTGGSNAGHSRELVATVKEG